LLWISTCVSKKSSKLNGKVCDLLHTIIINTVDFTKCLKCFYRAMLYAGRGYETCMSSVRLHVCRSVTMRYRDQIGCNSLNYFTVE